MCGEALELDAVFCGSCGALLLDEEVAAPPPSAVPSSVPSPPTSTPSKVPPPPPLAPKDRRVPSTTTLPAAPARSAPTPPRPTATSAPAPSVHTRPASAPPTPAPPPVPTRSGWPRSAKVAVGLLAVVALVAMVATLLGPGSDGSGGNDGSAGVAAPGGFDAGAGPGKDPGTDDGAGSSQGVVEGGDTFYDTDHYVRLAIPYDMAPVDPFDGTTASWDGGTYRLVYTVEAGRTVEDAKVHRQDVRSTLSEVKYDPDSDKVDVDGRYVVSGTLAAGGYMYERGRIRCGDLVSYRFEWDNPSVLPSIEAATEALVSTDPEADSVGGVHVAC